uniref:Peptidase A1 domain-containing protein n=1 Tax=Populus davidiana TaxID=266767 RepID=A0A6M2EEH5_9ROSI
MKSDDDQSPQLKGVVIISLPPPDNPSLGKTITAFTLTNNDYPQSHQTPQTHQEDQLPISPPPPPSPSQNSQLQFPSSRLFLGTPRRLLSFVFISLFALAIYSSLFTNTFQELKSNNNDDDDDDQKPKSFVFPLYHKLGVREIPLNDLENHLRRFVYKENLVASVDHLNGPHKISKLASSNAAAAMDSSAIFPVRGNLHPDGLYFTYMLVGSPPQPYYLDFDTGSDLTWIQCDAPCTSCAKGANAWYKPRRGNIVPPKDLLCMEVQRNQKAGYCETCDQCDYEIEYADHSSSMGVLATDKLLLMVANGSQAKLNFIFGCAYDQQGLLLKTLVKTDGILGLSRAKVSLPSQLASQGIINNVIGHCLTTDVGGGGYMFLGDDFVPRWGMAWVPMLDSPSMEFYHTEVVKLNYGSSPLSLGGMESRAKHILFDSGSSYTYFPKEAYSELVASLNEVSGAGLVQSTSDTTLPLCWRANFPIRSVKDVKKFFKTLTFEFGTKWLVISTKFRIPPEGYLMISDKGNVCLGILDGSKVHDGSTIILGDVSLRGQLVVYDNVNKKIGWTPSECAKPKRSDSLQFFDGLPFFDG